MEVFKLFGTIGLNNKEANQGIKETTENAKGSSEKIGESFKGAAKVIAAAFAVKKLIDFGTMAVEAAASAKAVQAQFDQVFNELGPAAQTSVNTLGKELGMLPNRLKGPLTDATSRFKGLGLSTETAMGMAERSVRAAADAAAFYDVSYESANGSLSSFTKGNYEAGESIGIFANDTQMANFAITQGVVSSTGEWQKLDEATKQATRLEYAENMQSMAGATGQAARESDGYENVMGNVKQAWQDFLAIVGGPILQPVISGMQTLAQWLTAGAQKLQDFHNWLGENKTAATLIGVVLATLTALLIAYDLTQGTSSVILGVWNSVAAIGTTVTTGLGAAFTFLTGPIGLAILAVAAVVAAGILLYKNWDTVKEKLGQFGSFIEEKFEAIKGAIMRPIDAAKNFIGDAIEKIKSFFRFEWSLPKLKLPHVSISGSFSLLPPKVPSFGIDWYAKGGIFNNPTIFGSDGMNLKGIGEAGPEAALPLNDATLGAIGNGIVRSSGLDTGILGKIIDRLDTLVEVVMQLLNLDPKWKVLLDSGVLVGELTPYLDQKFAQLNDDKERGRKR